MAQESAFIAVTPGGSEARAVRSPCEKSHYKVSSSRRTKAAHSLHSSLEPSNLSWVSCQEVTSVRPSRA